MYVHNNAGENLGLVAENVRAYVILPTDLASSITVSGKIYSSNANPTTVWDETHFSSKNGEKFNLAYVDGSAKYYNFDQNNKLRTFSLDELNDSNDLFTSKGHLLGYDQMDGKIPGCYQYDGVVTIDVKVHKSVAAKVSKQVRIKGTKGWNETVDAKVGDEVEYQIEYVNLLNETVNDVMIRDVLPTNVEYVNDTTYLYNANYQSGVLLKDNTVATSGINIGSYVTNGNAYVRFTGKVVDKTMGCGDNQLVNWASATVKGLVYKDNASVMVAKTCEEPKKEEPKEEPKEDPKEEPKEEPKKEEPKEEPKEETPTEIVSTGPETIVTGALGAGSIVTALGYFIASRKKF